MIELKIIGNIGSDAVSQEINGRKYASFDVAATEGYGDNKRTTWVRCLRYDPEGKLCPHLRAGAKIYASGSPNVSSYNEKAYLSLWVNALEFCGSKQTPEQPAATASSPSDNETVDDLPF